MEVAKRTLNDTQKRAIIARLAAYETPTFVAQAIKADFGVSISPQGVEFYDPAKNPRLIREWRELFDVERQKFLRDFDAEPINALNFRQSRRRAVLESGDIKSPRLRLDILHEAAEDFYQHAELMRKQGTWLLPSTPGAPRGQPAVSTQSWQERVARIAELLERGGLKLVPESNGDSSK